MQGQANVLNLFVEFRFQLFNMKTIFYFELRVSAGMIENLKTRDITLIPTTFRSTKMFKNVGIFVPKNKNLSGFKFQLLCKVYPQQPFDCHSPCLTDQSN